MMVPKTREILRGGHRKQKEPVDFSRSGHSGGPTWIEQAEALVEMARQSHTEATSLHYRANHGLYLLLSSLLSPFFQLPPYLSFPLLLLALPSPFPPHLVPFSPPLAHSPDWSVALCGFV